MKPVRGGGSASAHDDDELIGVGHDDAFEPALGRGVVVVGGAPQHRRALLDPDDPGQRVGLAGHVADDRHPVADDDAAAAEFAGPHRGDGRAVDLDR